MVSEHPGKAEWPPPNAGERQAQIDAQLASLKENHPQWDVRGKFGGWLAVPSGTPVLESIDLDGIDAKITAHERGDDDVTDSFRLTETAAGKVPGQPRAQRHPVRVVKASTAVLQAALKAANGDASRVKVQDDGSVIVVNGGKKQ